MTYRELVNRFLELSGHLSDVDMGELLDLVQWTVDIEIGTDEWKELVDKTTKLLLKHNEEKIP